MQFEVLVALLGALSFGLGGLFWGTRGYGQSGFYLVLSCNLSLAGLLVYLLYAAVGQSMVALVNILPGSLGGGVGSVYLAGGWQYSTLLACVLPTLVFGFLFLIKPQLYVGRGLAGLGFLLLAGLLFVMADTLVWWLIAFELLLLVSLYLLRLTSKSERIGEAVTEMFFWTLAGSICLLFGLAKQAVGGQLTLEGLHERGGVDAVTALLLVLGFGVKLPLWPCFSWLLKAHVEASVEFSILLSGVVVKFGALGLYRVFLLHSSTLCACLVLACGTLAIVEAVLRIVTQRDLKRVVALTTVVEMNWVGLCVGLGGVVFDEVGAFLLVAHSLTTTGEFFSVEALYRRYGTRDLAVISGVAFAAPMLYFCLFATTLVTIGFPGTSLFAAKLLFLTAVSQFSVGLCVLYTAWFVLVLPVAFLRLWVPVWFGQPRPSTLVYDLTGRELGIFLLTLLGGVCLGLCPTLALDVA